MRRTLNSLVAVAALAAALSGCAAEQSTSGSAASVWIGKRRHEVVEALGQPTSATPLIETGGEVLIYAKSGQPHYAFETGPDGTVVSAAELK
jgi:hypothetical protein